MSDAAERQRTGVQVRRPSGSVLATRGTPARQFIVILEGAAESFGSGAQRRLEAGATIGAIEILHGAPHPATVIADTSVLLWVVTATDFATLLRELPNPVLRPPTSNHDIGS